MPATSPKSYWNVPRVSLGHEAGSTATMRVRAPSRRLRRRNGKPMPAKFEPPPKQPDHHVGFVARHLHLHERLLADDGLVQQHVVQYAAQAVARVVGVLYGCLDRLEIASPRLPEQSGSSARARRPASVSVLGEGITSAPHVFISNLR